MVRNEDDGPGPLRVPRYAGAPRFVTARQFAAHHGTRGEVTRDMSDYTRMHSLSMTQAEGEGTADTDDAQGESKSKTGSDGE